jgi:cation:H+ antiporter
VITWTFLLAVGAFLVSIWVMVEGAEKFTSGLLRASVGLGVPTFSLGYLVSGLDLENLAVGIAGAVGDLPGISMGTIIGSGIFMLTFAVGMTALFAPLRSRTPRRLILMTLSSPLPLGALALDGELSRVDGAILLVLALLLIGYVLWTAQRHPLLRPKAEKVGKAVASHSGWWPAVLIVGGTVAIVIGAELFNWSVRHILVGVGWDDTLFGMVVVAAAVSFEEVPRMVVPARRGHAEISVGNILGTVMFFVLFNAGVIALVHPLVLDASVLNFHWLALMVVLAVISVFLWRGRIGRGAGGVLLAGYAAYVSLAIWLGYRLMG